MTPVLNRPGIGAAIAATAIDRVSTAVRIEVVFMIVGWFMVLIVSRLLGICFWRKGRGNRGLVEDMGGEKGVNLLLVIACLEIKEKRIKRVR